MGDILPDELNGATANRYGKGMSIRKHIQRVGSGKEGLRRLVALAPHDEELRLRLAKELIGTGNFEEALEQIRAVIRLDPNNLPARQLRLALYEKQPSRS